MRILVVDDNQDMAESTAFLLTLHGHDARPAFNGLAAIELARQYRPEVAIIDIGLAPMDGYEVARRLRQIPGLEETVLIALTGFGTEEARLRSQEAGFHHHFVKPMEQDMLLRLLTAGHPELHHQALAAQGGPPAVSR